jgi:hypothetical protein
LTIDDAEFAMFDWTFEHDIMEIEYDYSFELNAGEYIKSGEAKFLLNCSPPDNPDETPNGQTGPGEFILTDVFHLVLFPKGMEVSNVRVIITLEVHSTLPGDAYIRTETATRTFEFN